MIGIIKQTLLKLLTISGVLKRRKLRQLYLLIAGSAFVIFTVMLIMPGTAKVAPAVCTQLAAGSVVTNPPEIKDPTASNPVNLEVISTSEKNCYLANGHLQAPTLRLTPKGGTKVELVLQLTNRLPGQAQPGVQKCVENMIGKMPPENSTNLHFHGLNVSPACYQDEVVNTVIQPSESFKYKLQLPKQEPPGMYWYHPHIHMSSEGQVLNGLTGAIIVEGIKKFNKQAAQLPERVFVLRDMEVPPSLTDSNAPSKDISINLVPIKYQGNGNYDPPAVIQMNSNEQQFWRVANTAADTYFDLQLTYDGIPQQLGLVALDGVPINVDGQPKNQTLPVMHILLPPAGRAEFIVTGPGVNIKDAKFLTLKVDRGTEGDNDTQRTIARIDTQAQMINSLATTAPESIVDETQVSGKRFSGLSQINPVIQRTLYFSQDDSNFYITVQGQEPPKPYEKFTAPAITVQEGTVEEWTVENRAPETHAFHIHQIHFLVMESPDSNEVGILRDTINIPAWDGQSASYPKVKLRMDFRGVKKDISIAGTFVYHCHILEHEDGGMMAPIQVKS
ncbi:MAG: multicopper oxidase domain-containing protein [Nostoc sp.]|uniref:multicopper oxidase family protein n=1 Tax=Nostoc sp. TaxID=1180 RepID=UPI002FFD0CC7